MVIDEVLGRGADRVRAARQRLARRVGMAIFLKPNMVGSPEIFDRNISLRAAVRNAAADHGLGQPRRRSRSRVVQSLARVADQRLLLAAEQQQQNAENAEQAQLGAARMPIITGSHSKPPA